MAARAGAATRARAHLALSGEYDAHPRRAQSLPPRKRGAQILRYHFVEPWRVGTIASQLGVHHCTVERVLGETGVERERRRPRRPSKLDPYLGFITETLERFPTLTAARRFDMVKARGYAGGPTPSDTASRSGARAGPVRRICDFAPCSASKPRSTGHTSESSPSGAPNAP